MQKDTILVDENHKAGVVFSLEMTLVKIKAKNKAAFRALHGPDGEKNRPRANIVVHLLNQRIKNCKTSSSVNSSIILAENAEQEGNKKYFMFC